MASIDNRWAEPSGLPDPSDDSPRRSRPLVLLFVAAVLLGALGVLVALRHDDTGMEAFCGAYRDITDSPPLPRFESGSAVLDSPEVRGAKAKVENATRLARASGNERVMAAFAAQQAEFDRAGSPGTTPEEQARIGERAAKVFVNAFKVAVEECKSAGYPVIEGS